MRPKVRYNCGDGIIEVTMRDSTGKKEEDFKANQSDKKTHGEIGLALYQKYGIDLSPMKKDSGLFDF